MKREEKSAGPFEYTISRAWSTRVSSPQELRFRERGVKATWSQTISDSYLAQTAHS